MNPQLVPLRHHFPPPRRPGKPLWTRLRFIGECRCSPCLPGAFSPHRSTASLAITPLGTQALQLCRWQALDRKASMLDRSGKENPRGPESQIETHMMGFNIICTSELNMPTRSTAQGKRRETGLEMRLTGSTEWTHEVTCLLHHKSLICSLLPRHPTHPVQPQPRLFPWDGRPQTWLV